MRRVAASGEAARVWLSRAGVAARGGHGLERERAKVRSRNSMGAGAFGRVGCATSASLVVLLAMARASEAMAAGPVRGRPHASEMLGAVGANRGDILCYCKQRRGISSVRQTPKELERAGNVVPALRGGSSDDCTGGRYGDDDGRVEVYFFELAERLLQIFFVLVFMSLLSCSFFRLCRLLCGTFAAFLFENNPAGLFSDVCECARQSKLAALVRVIWKFLTSTTPMT